MIKTMLALALSLFTLGAFADGQQPPPQKPAPEPVAFQVPLARLSGNLNCTVSMGDKSFDCNAHVAGKGATTIDMRAMHGRDQTVKGYFGIDKVTEGATNYKLMVSTDTDHNVKGISLFTDTTMNNGTAVTATMFAAPSTALQAFNLNPLSVDISDINNIKVVVGFTIYAPPMASIMTASNDDVISAVMEKLQPYLLSLVSK